MNSWPHTERETKKMRLPKPGSKTKQRERKQTAKWKITPIAGARPVPLQSTETHHPNIKNNDSREKGEGVTQVKRKKPA